MVQFSEVPSNARSPFAFIEIDPTRAQQGPTVQAYRTLGVGQRLAAGTIAADVPFLASSSDQVGEAAGFGSILHNMAIAYFAANTVTEAWFVGIDDAGGAVAATRTLTVSGSATEAGTVFLYIAGRQIQVGVASGDAATDVAAAIDAAIAASPFAVELPVTSGVGAAVVTLTARNAGTQGNSIDVRLNYNAGERLPDGITIAIAVGVAGATDPTVTAAITALGDVQYNAIALGLNDATTLTAFEAELADRFTALRQIDGHAFACVRDTHSNLVTFGNARNSPHSTVIGLDSPLSSPWEIAASAMGVVARAGQADPARPFQTLTLPGVIGSAQAEEFTRAERDTLLNNGIATLRTDVGRTTIDRMISTYQTNANGAASTAFLDVNTLLTLSFLRYDLRTRFLNTFPRAKLAGDQSQFAEGQVVVTPRTAAVFILSVFRSWIALGLVEDFEQFEEDLIVEISASDPNRLEVLLAPNLVNQLRILGARVAFIL